MVRNKSQSQEGLNDTRRENLGENKQNKQGREWTQEDDQRGNFRKSGKNSLGRKGSPGKIGH